MFAAAAYRSAAAKGVKWNDFLVQYPKLTNLPKDDLNYIKNHGRKKRGKKKIQKPNTGADSTKA